MSAIAEYGVKLGLEKSDLNDKIGSHLKDAEGHIKGFMERTKSTFGRQSAFGEIGELLVGGGVVVGVSIMGRALSDMTAKAVEMKDKFVEGKVSAGEMVDEILKGTPVIGGFYSALSNVVELFTGEKALIRDINESLQRQSVIMDAMAKGAKSYADYMKQSAANIKNMRGGGESTLDAQLDAIDERAKAAKKAEADAYAKLAPVLNAEITKSKAEHASVRGRWIGWNPEDDRKAFNALQSDERALTNANINRDNRLKAIDARAEEERAAAKKSFEDKRSAEENDAITKGEREYEARMAQQYDYLQSVEAKTIDDFTEAKITALEISGDKLGAAKERINADYEKASVEAIRDEQKAVAEAMGDEGFVEKAQAALADRLAVLAKKRDTALDRADYQYADKPQYGNTELAKQTTGRRHTTATLAEVYNSNVDSVQKQLVKLQEKATNFLERIASNTAPVAGESDVQTVSIFASGG